MSATRRFLGRPQSLLAGLLRPPERARIGRQRGKRSRSSLLRFFRYRNEEGSSGPVGAAAHGWGDSFSGLRVRLTYLGRRPCRASPHTSRATSLRPASQPEVLPQPPSGACGETDSSHGDATVLAPQREPAG